MKQQGPRSADWSAKRDDVLLAAATLIASHGVEAVSMRDIAARAELHVSTLYYYFENKDALYRAVCHWAFDRISSVSLAALQSGGTGRERIRLLVEAAVAFLTEDAVAARIIDQEFIFDTGIWKDRRYPESTRAATIALAELLTELEVALVADIPAVRLAEILWDMIYGVVRFSPGNRRVLPDAARVDKDALVAELMLIFDRMLFDDRRAAPRTDGSAARQKKA